MPSYQWYAVKCVDCGTAIGYSHFQIEPHLVYCLHCAHSHAEVASWMMPMGSDYSTNGLYGVQVNSRPAIDLSMRFRKGWNWVFARLEKHRIAKCDNKRLGI